MSNSYIMNLLASAVAVIVGIVIHESAHAAAAWALGDKTARSRGRVSLNPLNHIDPFGTILLPLLMLAAGGPVFAFAKPVPVYLNNLKHPKRDEVLVSAAGPASNIALVCLAAAIMHTAYGNLYTSMSFAVASQIMNFGATFIVVNLSLAFFNLIPIPPLDGSHALNLAVSALFGPLVGDAVAALAGVLCSLALLGGVVYLYVQTRSGALVIFAALALLLSALKELRLARRAIKV